MEEVNVEAAKEQALKEIREEEHRAAVDRFKRQFRDRRSLLDRLFPYRLIIVKKGETNDR